MTRLVGLPPVIGALVGGQRAQHGISLLGVFRLAEHGTGQHHVGISAHDQGIGTAGELKQARAGKLQLPNRIAMAPLTRNRLA